MIRVLHLINAFQPGGIETWLLRMLAQIPRRQIAMDFVCKGADTGLRANDARRLGASVMHFPLRPTHAEFIGGLTRTLRSGQYDLVHSHLDVTGGPAVWAVKRIGVPVISSFHNTHFAPQTWTRLPIVRQLRAAYSRVSIGYSLKHSDVVTGCSRAVLDNIQPNWEGDSRYRLLYYGVESHPRAELAERAEFRQSIGIPPRAPIVLHVGRFFAQKNHPALLRIFTKIRQDRPSAHLVLVGDGALRGEIESLVRELQLGDSVHLLGMRNDVPKIMAASDVMLFPSFHEGLPVVSLEACGCGLPLVGSDIPGTNESIVSGVTGLLHPVTDEIGMAQSVLRLMADSQLAERIRTAAYERVDLKFSRAASANSLHELYQETLSAKEAAPNCHLSLRESCSQSLLSRSERRRSFRVGVHEGRGLVPFSARLWLTCLTNLRPKKVPDPLEAAPMENSRERLPFRKPYYPKNTTS